MNAALLHQSKFIKAVEFGIDAMPKEPTLTIKGVKLEELEREDNTKENKGIIRFTETTKGWVLNVTNLKALIAMFGNETDDWVGKRVTLYPEPNSQSDSGLAIRVRGSPDIEKAVTYTLKLARKKPRDVTLTRTGQGARQGRGAQDWRTIAWAELQVRADELHFVRGEKDAQLIALFKTATKNTPWKELMKEDFDSAFAALEAAQGGERGDEPPPGIESEQLTDNGGNPL